MSSLKGNSCMEDYAQLVKKIFFLRRCQLLSDITKKLDFKLSGATLRQLYTSN